MAKILIVEDEKNMQEITLTHKEYELLSLFMTNRGQLFTREQLLNRI